MNEAPDQRNCGTTMNRWVRSLLLVTEVGGGFTGLTFTVMECLQQTDAALETYVFRAMFAGVSIYGIIAGIALVERARLGMWLSLVCLGAQIPVLSSPAFTYSLLFGVRLGVGWRADQGILALCQIGARMTIGLMHRAPLIVGVNLFALVLFMYLLLRVATHPVHRKRSAVPSLTGQ